MVNPAHAVDGTTTTVAGVEAPVLRAEDRIAQGWASRAPSAHSKLLSEVHG